MGRKTIKFPTQHARARSYSNRIAITAVLRSL